MSDSDRLDDEPRVMEESVRSLQGNPEFYRSLLLTLTYLPDWVDSFRVQVVNGSYELELSAGPHHARTGVTGFQNSHSTIAKYDLARYLMNETIAQLERQSGRRE